MSRKDDGVSCHFCPNKSLYTCPQCNIPYCSSKCYKCQRHVQCSENFYKGLVEEELKGATASNESKKKMHEILQRLQQEEDEDECLDSDDDEDIAERLKGIDLDDSDAVWSKLSASEQQDFLDLLKDGKVSEMIPEWKAWWETNPRVAQLESTDARAIPAFMEKCPPVLERPPLSTLTNVVTSACIPCNILNVLASYVWVVRIFNGDHQEDCVDATEAALTLSPVLSREANYSSAEVAVNTPKMESQNHSWLCESEEFSLKVESDVRRLMQGPSPAFQSFYVASALSDLHTLLISCKKTLAPKRKKTAGIFTSSIADSKHEIPKNFAKGDLVQKCIKKIEFYLSYIREYPDKLFVK